MIVFNCIYCGVEIEATESIGFDGHLKDVIRYIDKYIVEKSKQCSCRKEEDKV